MDIKALRELAVKDFPGYCMATRRIVGENQHPATLASATVVQLEILNANIEKMNELLEKLVPVQSNVETPVAGKATEVVEEKKNTTAKK